MTLINPRELLPNANIVRKISWNFFLYACLYLLIFLQLTIIAFITNILKLCFENKCSCIGFSQLYQWKTQEVIFSKWMALWFAAVVYISSVNWHYNNPWSRYSFYLNFTRVYKRQKVEGLHAARDRKFGFNPAWLVPKPILFPRHHLPPTSPGILWSTLSPCFLYTRLCPQTGFEKSSLFSRVSSIWLK